ncbi:MAG: alpha/beta hydrolase [Actinobacteria bacterium]|nr:alpha/beta hydrolase [Actinomycetota bacterium]
MTPRVPVLVPGPGDGQVEILVTGRGEPSSLFVHGLAGSIATTRPYAGAVRGRRTFMHLAGHGRTSPMLRPGGAGPPASDWSYAALAAQVRAVADREEVAATRALGISMGAGALCAVVADEPDRFDRLVLVLPAALDSPRDDTAARRFATLGHLVDQGDVAGVSAHLLAEQPASARARPDVQTWCDQQARQLMTSVAAGALRTVPHEVPLTDRSRLRAVDVPVLVIAQEGDPTHPVRTARELAQVLPTATLEVLPAGGIIWEHRARVRALVGQFLSPSPTSAVPSLGVPHGGPDG